MRTVRAQEQYESQLRKVARIIGNITASAPEFDLVRLLEAYAKQLEPWARRTASRMLLEVDRSTETMFRSMSEEISFQRRQELLKTPVGLRLAELLEEQVEGIKSIPLRAAKRVEELAAQTLLTSGRSKEISEAIQASGSVSRSDANRLARTSVTGAATALVQARAEYAGSPGYVWETSRDGAVRESHRQMQGKFVPWNEPPTIDNYTAHAGQFANCRCWARPVLELE